MRGAVHRGVDTDALLPSRRGPTLSCEPATRMLLEGRSRDAKWGRFAQVVRPEGPAQRLAIRDLAREQADLDVQVVEAIRAVLKGATTRGHKVLQSLVSLQLQIPNASQISFEPRHKAALVSGAQLMCGIH